jgi:hypothetical protein
MQWRYNSIQEKADKSINDADKNAAIGEAKFIRGTAYYYLAMLWGAVPIIEDNSKLIQDPLLKRNVVSDVYQFVVNDLTFAANNLPRNDEKGRVTTGQRKECLQKLTSLCLVWKQWKS